MYHHWTIVYLVLLVSLGFVSSESILKWRRTDPNGGKVMVEMSEPTGQSFLASMGSTHVVHYKEGKLKLSGFFMNLKQSRPDTVVGDLKDENGVVETPVDICSGQQHVLVLTKENHLFSWGYNHYGQVGIGHKYPQVVPTPTRVIDGEMKLANQSEIAKIVNIFCGGSNSMVLTDNNQVYSWGYGRYGLNGDGTRKQRAYPRHVKFPETAGQILNIAVGNNHAMALTLTPPKHGGELQLWCWGDNTKGACGPKPEETLSTAPRATAFYFMPTPIDSSLLKGQKIKQMTAGDGFTLLLAEKGALFGIGTNKLGQLGLPNATAPLPNYHPLTRLPWSPLKEVTANLNTVFGIMDEGTTYYSGSKGWMSLPISPIDSVYAPTKITPASGGIAPVHFLKHSSKGKYIATIDNK